MKIILNVALLLTLLSCCSENEAEISAQEPAQQTFDLGITENNMYPNWPNTWRLADGDNEWHHWKRGDTLVIHKISRVDDHSMDDMYYSFLTKPGDHIRPLRMLWITNDPHSNPPRMNNIAIDVPIQNFRLQQYIENKLLVCETSLPLSSNGFNYSITDRMWVKLD